VETLDLVNTSPITDEKPVLKMQPGILAPDKIYENRSGDG
jgi:hypothetical protein